jgi:hypothetical protein
VFLLIDALLAKQLGAMKTLGDEFVSGYIKLAEGEKDPRNLMLAFGIGRVVLIEFDPYKHLDVSISIDRENNTVPFTKRYIAFTGHVRYHILLFSHNFPPATQRSVQYHTHGSPGGPEEEYVGYTSIRPNGHAPILGEAAQ